MYITAKGWEQRHCECAVEVVYLDAVIFDCDGLIVDTELPDFLSWQETYAAYGAVLPKERWMGLIGGSAQGFDLYGELEGQAGGPIDRNEVRRQRRARFRQLVDQEYLLPGVQERIDEAVDLGLKLAVASSSRRAWVEGELRRLSIRKHFDAVATRDDVGVTKPDPAVYRHALRQLGVPPDGAVALEDSRNGMLAAKAAGLYCVVAPNELTAAMDFSEADMVVSSLASLKLAEVKAVLDGV